MRVKLRELGIVAMFALSATSLLAQSSRPAAIPAGDTEEEGQEQKVGENWREQFDKIYSLEAGQMVKRIAPPFIPERLEYYRVQHRGQARAISRGPDCWQFRWNGQLKMHSMSFGSESSLATGLNAIGLARYEFQGPEELLKAKLPGDWIVREGASREACIADLQKIVAQAWDSPVHFVRKAVERKAIVVRGTYAFHELDDAPRDPGSIHIYGDDFDAREGAGGGTDDFDGFLRHVGGRLGRPIINEVKQAPKQVSWRNHRSGYIRYPDSSEENDAIVEKVIQHLGQQTSLEFRQEVRKMDVWFVVTGDAPQSAPEASVGAPSQAGLRITWCVTADQDFANAKHHTTVIRPGTPLKTSPDKEGWDLELAQRDGRFQFDYSYGPCRMLDLGAGPLDLSADFGDTQATPCNPREVPVQVGHVYVLEQSYYEHAVLFRVDALVASASQPATAPASDR